MAYRKYNAKKTVINGIKFDSKREAARYCELVLLKKAHKIKELELQPKFELQSKYKKGGKTIRAINYIADFKYYDVDKGEYVVEDVKGMKTEVYKLKKKLVEFKYPEVTIVEV